jgi:hypothetical protein
MADMSYGSLVLTACVWMIVQSGAPTGAASGRDRTAAVLVRTSGRSAIRVTLGNRSRVIDLVKDVPGCLDLFDPTENVRSRTSATVKVVHVATKADSHYIVLLLGGQANCNVQGHCGAAENFAVMWMKLDSRLQPQAKQVELIEHCQSSLVCQTCEWDDARPGRVPLKLTDGKLTIESETLPEAKSVQRVLYDTASPEKGFSVSK